MNNYPEMDVIAYLAIAVVASLAIGIAVFLVKLL